MMFKTNDGLSPLQVNNMEIPGLNLTGADFFPYVFYKINLDFIEPTR